MTDRHEPHVKAWDSITRAAGYDPDGNLNAQIIDDAIETNRKAFWDMHRMHSGPAADKQVAYQNRTHWTIISMFGIQAMKAQLALSTIKVLSGRVADLEAKLAESSRGMDFKGVWKVGEYDRGDVVTHHGSAWHCNEKTTDQPGTSSAFTLMVKKGRDAK